MNFIEGARELLAGAASPLGAADEAHEFALGERHVRLGRPAVAGMLLDERDENLVRQRARLSEFGIGTDDDILFRHSPVELNLLGVSRRPLGVMAEQRAGDAQQRVLHVEFVVDDSRLGRVRVLLSGGHVLHDTAMKARPSLRCVERMWRAAPIVMGANGRVCSRLPSRWQPAAKNTSRILEGRVARTWRLFGVGGGSGCALFGQRQSSACGVRRSPGATRSGASIVWRRWMSVLVSLSRSSSASICVSFTDTWPRRNSFSLSRRTTYRSSGPRTVASVRGCSWLFVPSVALIFHSANVRVRSRLVATIRDCSHLFDVGDVAVHGVGRDEVFFAGLGLDLVAIEL